jgi:Zn finger protein HypA/HybF involved in hydrogenase expression
MSDQLSRRDFFAFLASPLTRAAQRVSASEQRRRNLQALQQTEASTTCARCRVPFAAQADETLCPLCRDAEAKNRALIQSLYE